MSGFDPIAAFQAAFGSVFSDITSAIASIPANVIGGLTAAFNNTIGPLIDSLVALPGTIYSQLLDIKDQILGGLAGIPGKVAGLLGGIDSAVSAAFVTLAGDLTGIVNTAGDQLRAFFAASFTNLQSFIGSSVSSLSSALNGIPAFVQGLITDTNAALSKIGADLSSQIQADLAFVANIGATLSSDIGNVQNAFTTFGTQLANAFQGFANFGSQLLKSFTQDAQALYNLAIKPTVDSFNNEINNVATLINSLTKAPAVLTPTEAIAITSTAGAAITTVLAARWGVDSVIKAATFGQVKVLDKQLTELLESIGIVGLGAKFNLAPIDYGILPYVKRGWQAIFTPNIPGPGEILDMQDRGALDGTGLIRAPAQVLEHIKENGLNSDWADRLWTTHFNPLGLDQIASALFRGILSSDQFQRRLDFLKVYPQDKALLQQLIYSFPGIRQIRSLVKFGLLSDKQIEDTVNALGLRADYVKPFIDSLQEYNLAPLYDRTDAAAIAAYADYLIGEDDLTKLLQQSKKPKGIIDQEVALAKFKRQVEYTKAQIATIKTLLKKGILTPDDALKQFEALGMDTQRASLITSLAQFELDAATNGTVKKAAPDLSVSQIQKAMKEGVITQDQGIAAFTARGYDSTEIRTLMDLTFGSGSITSLTTAEILGGLKKGVLSVADTTARLMNRGYSVADVGILIATAGF